MSQCQSSKVILIVDPLPANGLLLAEKFLSNSYHVLLLTTKSKDVKALASEDILRKSNIEIHDLENSCNDNLSCKISSYDYEQIIFIDRIFDSELLFGPEIEDEFVLQSRINKVKKDVTNLSEFKNISLIHFPFYSCSLSFIEEITKAIIHYLRSEERRLYVNFLNIIFHVETDYIPENLFLNPVETSIPSLVEEPQFNLISLRDIFRSVFEVLGAEIEFCGRDAYERGVIVDFDEAVLTELGFSTPKIRLGNTVVKVNEQNYETIYPLFESENKQHLNKESDQNILDHIRKYAINTL